MLVIPSDAHEIHDDHHRLAVPAVGRDAREEAEQRVRREVREADGACLRRRVGDREDSSGYAICVDVDPMVDSICPACSRTKSRLRQSGVKLGLGASAGEQVERAETDADEHHQDLDLVVDDADERCTGCDGNGLRHAEHHVRSRG